MALISSQFTTHNVILSNYTPIASSILGLQVITPHNNTPNDISTKSYHMRTLPSTSIALSSKEGQRRLDEARANGTAEGFFDMITYFEPQKELAYCFLASLITVLNTLRVDPGEVWKGPFRWYDEGMIADEKTLRKVRRQGVSLENTRDFIPKNKVKFKTYFAHDTSLDDFRFRVRRACSSASKFIICNYSRKVLDQTGDGHHSPIGAYHGATDSVLILDVARYKYPPHWVPCNLMWEAMNTALGTVNKKSRGYVMIRALNKYIGHLQ